MSLSVVPFLAIALFTVAACVRGEDAIRLPTPTVVFQTNPDPANAKTMMPSTEPLVLLSTMAFMCYMNAYGADNYCQMVSPANSAYSAPRVTLKTEAWSTFDAQPQQLSPESAVYSTQYEQGSYWAASSPYVATEVEDRFNSTAAVSTDKVGGNVYVPYGVHAGMDFVVSVNGLNLSDTTTNYVLSYSHAANRDGMSLLHNVIYYRGWLLFMHNNTFYQYNATSHLLIRKVENPCQMDTAENGMNLVKSTFGQDVNGDLDAFIVYGNTTKYVNGVSQAGFVVCRVSHNTGLTKWNFTLAEDFVVDDVSAGAGLLFFSGYGVTTGTADFQTFVLDATTGTYYNHIARSLEDGRSYPVVVPASAMPTGCGAAIVMQQHLNTSAFCLTPLTSATRSVAALWGNAAFQCNQRPIFDPLTGQIVCVYSGNYIVSLQAATGTGVWIDTSSSAMTSPQLVIENGQSYAYVLDLDATLFAYQIALPTPSPSTSAPVTSSPQGQAASSGGLGGGAVAGIVIVVIAVVGGLVAFAVLRGRNMMRRTAYQAPINAEQQAINISV